eukprot:TRINITY_DN29690_c0_g1_i1.p1 TRINITY_DN29690_c0_g1~~TRINITY_DN29690_c0_g1_i1.p1  ORF type:complete len:384 (-),score=133.76 TRINITY_DN29690_c0_g1_i1:61-1212(-)
MAVLHHARVTKVWCFTSPLLFPCSVSSVRASNCFHTTPLRLKKKPLTIKEEWKKKYRNLIVPVGDLDKKPSALEIKQKDLPSNTPTLGERMNRDVYRLFHQGDEKHGYHSLRKYPDDFKMEVTEDMKEKMNTDPKKAIKESFQTVANEIKLFAKEMKEYDVNSEMDKLPVVGGRRKEWGFETEEELNQWILTKDSDWGEGYSAAELELNPLGHAVLKGDLSTRVPADGRTQNAGYVNIASAPKRKSFAREVLMEDWDHFSHLTMNIRGDGRKYMLNVQVKRDFDILWNDRWHYPLYTRGGPYWQYVKIPWSKFYLGSRGSLQDKQIKIPLVAGVVGMSLTLMDQISGPFQLEIKDISLHCDFKDDSEDFAYEMYKIPNFWAGH